MKHGYHYLTILNAIPTVSTRVAEKQSYKFISYLQVVAQIHVSEVDSTT